MNRICDIFVFLWSYRRFAIRPENC